MIGIARVDEPAALAAFRAERLPAAEAEMRLVGRVDFRGYDLVKPDLFRMQHNKCCYCEKLEEQAKYRDVEHYRPKSLYWWLTWTWENLLFSCIDCNREHKRNQFPVVDEAARWTDATAQAASERPLVIDPSEPAGDPLVHIRFQRGRVHGKERWTPYGLTDRGRATIEVCGLDRPGLLDLYGSHVNDLVRPRIEPVLGAVGRDDRKGTFLAWDTARRALMSPTRAFRALSYDAMAVLVPAKTRDRYQLPHPPPR